MEKKKQSTFQDAFQGYNLVITGNRREGNTTRQVDNAIQALFSGVALMVRDHHNFGKHKKANQDLFDRILRRLSVEHKSLVESGQVKFNRGTMEIELLPHPKEFTSL